MGDLLLLTILVVLAGGTAGYKVGLTPRPHSRSASHPLLLMPAQLAPRGGPIRLSADKFSNLKRADGPSEEETRSLQIIMGVFGWLIGPRFAGSAVMGALCGYTAGAALVNAGGSTGLWAREIGWQAHQIAARNRVPELAQNVTTTAQRIARATASEMKTLSAQPTIAEARAALIAMVAAAWDKARAWADTSGVAASLLSLRVATLALLAPVLKSLEQWIQRSRENIELRRKSAGR